LPTNGFYRIRAAHGDIILSIMTSRRHFLQAAAGAAVAAQAASAQRTISPNDNVQIAIIGLGGMGTGDVESSLKVGGTKLVAVSDVYDGRLTHAKERWGNGLFTSRHYEEVLARPDVDAVIIATPDHWHDRISIDAMNAGKDVYCEKPMVQKLDFGPGVIEAKQRTGRIMQVGSQRVSSIVYKKAQDLIRQGAVGQLNMIEAWWDRNSAIGAWQYSIPTDASTATIDWERFEGRAPHHDFDSKRVFRWRNYRDYGTGVAGDLFVHLFSGMHFIMGALGPTRVYATGGLRFWDDGRDVPDLMMALCDYPKTDSHPAFNLALRVNFEDGATENSGFRFIGSEGILSVDRGVTLSKMPRDSEPGYTIETFANAEQQAFLKKYREQYPDQRPNADAMRGPDDEHFYPPPGYSDHLDHHRNFIEAVRTRKPVVEDPTFGFRAAGPALLANLSYFEQRVCKWDPVGMKQV
jgi:predicted dehydrogenase